MMKTRPAYEDLEKRVAELEQQIDELQSRTNIYEILFKLFPHGITFSDTKGKIIESNAAAEKLLGINKDEHEKRAIDGEEWQIIRPDGSEMPAEEWASVIALKENRVVSDCEMGVKKNGGDVVWINVTAAPIPLEGYGVVVTYNDITKRKQAENETQKLLSEICYRRKELSALLEAARTTPYCRTYNEAARVIFDFCRNLIGAQSGYVALLSEDGKENEVLFLEAGGLPCDVDPELPMPIRGLREVAYKTQKIAYDNNFAESSWMKYMPPGHVKLENVLFAPLNIENRTVGLMGIANKPDGFNARDIQAADAFGDLAAIALSYTKSQEALRASEERFRLTYYTSPDSINLNRLEDGMYIDINDGFTQIMGYTREDSIGKTSADLNIWENSDDRVRLMNGLKEKGFVENLEARFVSKDGSIRYGLMSARIIKIHNEEIIISITRDITKRKNSEEALRQSERDLRQSQKIAHLGSWHLDLATSQVEWTEELYRMYGFDPTFPPPPYTEHMKLFTPESWEKLSTSLTRTRDTGIPYELELETVREDGSNGWMWVRGELETDSTGKATGLWGAAQDITERKQTELALKESEKRFKALHNASFGGITIHDKGRIIECNKGLCEITGYKYHELIGMDGLQLISEKTRKKVLQNILAGYEKAYEAEGIRKNGEIYPLRLEARNIPYKGKNVRVVEFRDITESKRAEKEKEELEARLRQSSKLEAVGRLAGGVAHDFNNMLSIIIGHAELALEELNPVHPLYGDLDEIKRAAERSAELTRQLLAFARKQTISPKVLDLNKVVEGMTRMLQRLIGEDIDLTWLPGKNVWPVKMDPSQLDQILANLCVNARDAIANVGRISIETGNFEFDDTYCDAHEGIVPGQYVLLSVSDNGCGMDAETVNNIFEPFFSTKESTRGTGLGLATVYGAIKQNNGLINVYSEPGQGTTFKVYLPRHQPKTVDMTEAREKKPAESGHETVLLVEDEPAILKMTKMMLERLGYKVLAAETPEEAIRLASVYTSEIRLLVTDVVMPEMNGKELANILQDFYPDLKRLFMSGYTADVIAHHGVLDKGLNFIQKPFTRAMLGAKVREMLDQ